MSHIHELNDPFGNKVIIDESLCGLEGSKLNMEDIYDSVSDVIVRPSMMFKSNNHRIHQYYFRAIGWHTSLIIGVTKNGSLYEADECIKNPSPEIIGSLFKTCERLI